MISFGVVPLEGTNKAALILIIEKRGAAGRNEGS